MFAKIVLTAITTLSLAVPAFAQSKKVEVSVLGGWTLADGVSGDTVAGGDGNLYNRIDPKDSFNWGLMAGVNASDTVEVGFLFNQQMTTLEIGGTTSKDVGDFNINTYHGYVSYNLGDSDAKARPYILLGLGMTSYGGLTFTRANGQTQEIGGESQFSGTIGAGVKLYPSPNVGARFGIRWTPTYIKSDAEGWWCDPYWGCYVVGSAQYANQWDISGGLTFRF